MGCSSSKSSASAVARMLEYEQMAATEDQGLKLDPGRLDSEEWREGLVSPRSAFNMIHAGYCSAYFQNPTYLLIVDFRCLEDWITERLVTSIHHERFTSISDKGLQKYHTILLYDRDGSSVGNIKSPLRKTYLDLRSRSVEPKVVLGGFRALSAAPFSSLLERPRTIPYAANVQPTVHNSVESLHSHRSEESPQPELEQVEPEVGSMEPVRRAVTWMPSMILERQLYLGRADQASDPAVIQKLGITHVLSTSRVRANKFRGLVYILVNKTTFSASTLKLTTNFVLEALAGGGRVLVHGCDGFDQSAAVVVAVLMQHNTASLEDALWFVHNSRPGVEISCAWLNLLSRLEEDMLGKKITDLDSLWWKEL